MIDKAAPRHPANYLLAITPDEFTSVPCLNLDTYLWKAYSSIDTLPISVYAHRICQLNETIYLIGGILNDQLVSSHVESKNHKILSVKNKNCLNQLYSYQNKTWSQKSPMHIARANFGAVIHQQRLYVVGGRTNVYSNVVELTDTVEIYNPIEDNWTKGKNIHKAREGCGFISLAGQLYILGGFNESGALSNVERFDEKRQKWTPVKNMLKARSHADYIAYNGKIWAFGGGEL